MKKLLILSGKGGSGKTTVAAAFIDLLNVKALADCDVDAPIPPPCYEYGKRAREKRLLRPAKPAIDTENVCLRRLHGKLQVRAISLKDGKYFVDEYTCEGCGSAVLCAPNGAAALYDDKAGEQMLYKEERVFNGAAQMGRGNPACLFPRLKGSV